MTDWGEEAFDLWRTKLKASAGSPRLGVDTGGTFTDFALCENGRVTIEKRPSDPRDPGRPLRDALAAIDAGPVFLGTTVGTNAVLERKGARTALVTTAGFEDLLDLARQDRPRLYALEPSIPPPLVPRERRVGAPERITADGAVESGLDDRRLGEIVARIGGLEPESVAVVLLHAWRNDEHERRIADALSAVRPDLPISLSSRVLPERREFERLSATAVNAFLEPVYRRFLNQIETGDRPLALSVSSGGVTPAGVALNWPVRTLLSGPAAGVVAARRLAREGRLGPVLTLDMGGTSTDASWVNPDEATLPVTTAGRIGDVPIAFPSLDVVSVGAGGGSLARLDPAGALVLGPDSAGADPGPAAFGRGSEATLTDCALILGLLPADVPLASGLKADVARARDAVARLATPLGSSIETVAGAVLELALARMERALRSVSSARGRDPKTASLLAYGGAGGLFAVELSRRLGLRRVILPPAPGVFSAWGTLASPYCLDWGRSVSIEAQAFDEASPFHPFWEHLGPFVPALPDESGFHCSIGVRYPGQAHEILIAAGPDWLSRFHDEHRRVTGHARPDVAPIVSTLRVRLRSEDAPPPLPAVMPPEADPGPARLVQFGESRLVTPVLRRDRLGSDPVPGPALIVEKGACAVVPPGSIARRQDDGVLVIT